MQSENVPGVAWSSTGHMRMFVNTYDEVQVSVKNASGEIITQKCFVKTGYAALENLPAGVSALGHPFSDYSKGDVAGATTVAYMLDEDAGIKGPGGQKYYTEEEVAAERAMLKFAESDKRIYNEGGSLDGTKPQNDCSSFMIDLLRVAKFKFPNSEFGKTTITAIDGKSYSCYTPNQIALDLEKMKLPKYVFPVDINEDVYGGAGGQCYKDITEENAKRYVEDRTNAKINDKKK
jgi:hypothetical protein